MLRVPSGILGPPGPAQNRPTRALSPLESSVLGAVRGQIRTAHGVERRVETNPSERQHYRPLHCDLETRLTLLLLEMYRNLVQLLHFLPGSVPGPSSARADPAAVCESVRWGAPSCPGPSLTPMWRRGHLSPRPLAIHEGTEPMPVPFTGQKQSQGRDENFRRKMG